MRAAVIIPVYNHGAMIAAVAECAKDLGLPVIVVNDGSTDSTAAAIERVSGITVVTHSENRGKGAALLSGFAEATARGCLWAVTIDGDGQHIPEDAQLLLASAQNGERCLVLGRRTHMTRGPHVPWTSRFGREFSNFWVWVCGGPRLADSQSGFRLYPLPEVIFLGVRARRYQFEVEVLVRAHQERLPIREVPVRVIYPEKGQRVSHFRPWLDFLRNSKTFSRLLLRRLIRGVLGR